MIKIIVELEGHRWQYNKHHALCILAY